MENHRLIAALGNADPKSVQNAKALPSPAESESTQPRIITLVTVERRRP
jgi:hypothetical protein